MKPFATKSEAKYWGGGVIAAVDGGFISLHGRGTPSGPELYHVGSDGRAPGLIPGYVWAVPDNGGSACICTTCE